MSAQNPMPTPSGLPSPFWLKARPWILSGTMVLVFIQLLVLSPSSLEQPSSSDRFIESSYLTHLLGKEKNNRFGIPENQLPDYSIQGFHYVSSHGGKKEWRILARTAHLYNSRQFVHAREIQASLFNEQGSPTLITGDEAGYQMNRGILVVIGNVVTKFPDGFTLRSNSMTYFARERNLNSEETEEVRGEGISSDADRKLEFKSRGFRYSMVKNEIILPHEVAVRSFATDGSPTLILSDEARIDRNSQMVYFKMYPSRSPSEGYSTLHQPDLFVKSREMEMNYGSGGKNSQLKKMVAIRDVYIEELDQNNEVAPPNSPLRKKGKTQPPAKEPEETNEDWEPDLDDRLEVFRFATAGRAEFETEKNLIYLTIFPQVYQDNDTVTGDKITIHRNENIVEVKKSNAYSPGS